MFIHIYPLIYLQHALDIHISSMLIHNINNHLCICLCSSTLFRFIPVLNDALFTHPYSSMFMNISSMHSSKSIFTWTSPFVPLFFLLTSTCHHVSSISIYVNPSSIILIHLCPHPSTYLYTHSHNFVYFHLLHLHSFTFIHVHVHPPNIQYYFSCSLQYVS